MTDNARHDGRQMDKLRAVKIELGVNVHAEGSCLIEMGRTRVWITASVEDRVPPHRRGSGDGWITAEYSMLPRSTHDRGTREAIQGRIGGRTHEIQRLIGRSVRAAVDMGKIGERTITLDCDVLQADGGTRTASITGAFAALYMALKKMKDARMIEAVPVRHYMAAVSCGVIDAIPRLDLDYTEDFQASTDLNCVMTEDGRMIELQATAEGAPYTRASWVSTATSSPAPAWSWSPTTPMSRKRAGRTPRTRVSRPRPHPKRRACPPSATTQASRWTSSTVSLASGRPGSARLRKSARRPCWSGSAAAPGRGRAASYAPSPWRCRAGRSTSSRASAVARSCRSGGERPVSATTPSSWCREPARRSAR